MGCAAVLLAWPFLVGNARAQLIIDPTFESSVTSLPDASAFENAVDYAISQIESDYSNPITIHIDVAASGSPSVLGQSETYLYGTYTYGQVVSALKSSATDATDNLAYSYLPATDPTNGGSFYVATAEAQALKLLPSNYSGTDGTFTFGTAYSYALNPSDRAVAGEYDFIGVAEHEITEIMGRIPGLDTTAFPDNLPFDLFRYTAPGTLALDDNGAGVYYSLNGGHTNLMNFNDAALYGGDPQDWASGTNDAFNAFSSSGVENPLTATDLTTLDVLGYDLAAPEPQTWALLAAGGVLLLVMRRAGRGLRPAAPRRRR